MHPPLPAIVQETLDAFVAELGRRYGERIVQLRLFGSYARGEAHEESDVDVLVLLDRADRADERAIVELAADLIWQRDGVVLSPLVMSVEEFERWKARERRTPLEIEREGVPL